MKKSYPELGDNLEQGTTFPVVLAIPDRKYVRKLKEENPEAFEAMKERREMLLNLTGVQNLGDLMGRSDDELFTTEVRENILNSLVQSEREEERSALQEEAEGWAAEQRLKIRFLMEDAGNWVFSGRRSEKLNETNEKLQKYAMQADDLISGVIAKFFPERSSGINMTNEIRDNNDVASLLTISMDDGWDEKARFEAKRKLMLIELLAELDKAVMKQKMNNNDLSFLHDLMNRYIYDHEGKKKGAHEDRLLVARHGGDDFTNIDWRLEDIDKEQEINDSNDDPNVITMPMGLRSLRVGNNGRSKKIEFMVDSRHKERDSLALKLLRKDTKNPEELLSDLNGVRFVFQSTDDILFFERELESRLKDAGYHIEFTRTKTAVGNNDTLSCLKYNVNITNGDDRVHQYELQIFTVPEYLNYIYSTPHSWDEYEITRFFESSSSEALFPSSIYKKLATVRQEVAEKARERASRQPKEAQGQMDDTERTDIVVTPLSMLPAEAGKADDYQESAQ